MCALSDAQIETIVKKKVPCVLEVNCGFLNFHCKDFSNSVWRDLVFTTTRLIVSPQSDHLKESATQIRCQ